MTGLNTIVKKVGTCGIGLNSFKEGVIGVSSFRRDVVSCVTGLNPLKNGWDHVR